MEQSKPPALVEEPRLTSILEKYRAELLAIPKKKFTAIAVTRDRALTLTKHTLANFEEHEPTLEQELSPARAAQRRIELGRLLERAQAFFAADLLANQVFTLAEEQEWGRLRVVMLEYDRLLMKWARPLFDDDADLKDELDRIQAGTGHLDSAEDVVGLVTMFRNHWTDVEGQTPITRALLDRAEADATRMIEILLSTAGAEARDLTRAAFTAWALDYREIIGLGRYLERHASDVMTRFPGIHAERTARRDQADDGTPDDGAPASTPDDSTPDDSAPGSES